MAVRYLSFMTNMIFQLLASIHSIFQILKSLFFSVATECIKMQLLDVSVSQTLLLSKRMA